VPPTAVAPSLLLACVSSTYNSVTAELLPGAVIKISVLLALAEICTVPATQIAFPCAEWDCSGCEKPVDLQEMPALLANGVDGLTSDPKRRAAVTAE